MEECSVGYKLICKFMKDMQLWEDFKKYQDGGCDSTLGMLSLWNGFILPYNKFSKNCPNPVVEVNKSSFFTFLYQTHGKELESIPMYTFSTVFSSWLRLKYYNFFLKFYFGLYTQNEEETFTFLDRRYTISKYKPTLIEEL